MKTQRLLFAFLFLLTIFFPLHMAGARNTANYYRCVNRVGGEWNFGRAPNACNANSFGEDRVILNDFAVSIFQDGASRTMERERYMREVHAIVRDAAQYYLKKRKPTVSQSELDWWTLGIVTTAAHESYASHYRKASDGRIKMMRGDLGHGHGLMQIDDRGHFPAITNGTAWNIITNMTYGMDIFYAAWQRAPSQSCVGSATNYEGRVRAAWSAYNGGPSQICRFKKTTGTWAQNDKNFLHMLREKTWQDFVRTPLAKASINVGCLIEKRENCPTDGGPDDPRLELSEGTLYKIPNGAYCSLEGTALHCVSDVRDSICLRAVAPLDSTTVVSVAQSKLKGVTLVNEDRHALCKAYSPSLQPVGTLVEMKKNIFVRDTPGGGKVGIVLVGDVAEVIDFEIRDYPRNARYYKIRMGSLTGFVSGGDKNDHPEWLEKSAKKVSGPMTLAQEGDTIRLLNPAGVNLRATPGGALLVLVPVGTELKVLGRELRTEVNSVYYQVSFGGKTGFIYSGSLLPTDSTGDWSVRVREF